MKHLISINIISCILAASSLLGAEPGEQGKQTFFPAYHGFDGGLRVEVKLNDLEGFDNVKTMQDLATFASQVPGAVGFTASSIFEGGPKGAFAIIGYTHLSPKEDSWPLYLFDQNEANKQPGDKPSAASLNAVMPKVAEMREIAQKLIDAGGADGVTLPVVRDYDLIARAVSDLGGDFKHDGEFGTQCRGCRNIHDVDNPSSCALGVQGKDHWSCCGSTEVKGLCRYWELLWAAEAKE